MPMTPWMPAFAREHDAEVTLRVERLIQKVKRFSKGSFVLILTCPIDGIQLLGQHPGLFSVIGQEEAQRVCRVTNAAGRIDARGHHEAELAGGDFRVRDPSDRGERLETQDPGRRETTQSEVNQHPILATKGHEVCHGGQRDEIEVLVQHVGGGAHLSAHQIAQLVGDPRATEALVRIRTIGTLWVHDGQRCG